MGHVCVLVGIAAAVFARQQFIPHASGGIATIDIVEVIAVAAESIAQFGLACECDGFATRDKCQLRIARE